eukprot:m.293823 g.293823  ORF g.293823 m.293823 type:complete len:133 (+) comp32781_c0_seq1:220-618(+)
MHCRYIAGMALPASVFPTSPPARFVLRQRSLKTILERVQGRVFRVFSWQKQRATFTKVILTMTVTKTLGYPLATSEARRVCVLTCQCSCGAKDIKIKQVGCAAVALTLQIFKDGTWRVYNYKFQAEALDHLS